MATGAERVNPATLKRFIYRFARFNLSRTASDRHMGSRRRRCRWPPPDQDPQRRVSVLTSSTCRPVRRSGIARRATATTLSATPRRGHRHCGSSTPAPGRRIRRDGSVESRCTGTASTWSTGRAPNTRRRRSVQSLWVPRPINQQVRGRAPETSASFSKSVT